MGLNSFAPNSVIKSDEVNDNFQNLSDHGRNFTMKWAFSGTLVTGSTKDYIALPDTGTVSRVDLVVDTAPTGAAIIVDIERSTDGGATWVTIFTNQSNRPQIAASSRTGNTTTIDVQGATQFTHLFRANIEQVGSTIAGADLSVMVRGTYDLD